MALKSVSVQAELGSGTDIRVFCRNHSLVMDQPKNAAGQDLGPTPLEVLLAAVAGCFGSVARIIAHQQKIELNSMHFEIEADYDPAGLLGRNPEVRPGFQEVRIKVEIDANLDAQQKRDFLDLIEQRCPLADNMSHGTRLVSILA